MKNTPLPPQFAAFEQARLGYFEDDGRFVELEVHPRSTAHPKAHEARWVGGSADAQLVRAVLAQQRADFDAEFLAQKAPEDDGTLAHDTPARAWAIANGVSLEGEEA